MQSGKAVRPFLDGPWLATASYKGSLQPWVLRLPRWVRHWLLRRLLKIDRLPNDTYDALVKLADAAPGLLGALRAEECQAIVFKGDGLACWRDYLPAGCVQLPYTPHAAVPEPETQGLVTEALRLKRQQPYKVLLDLRWMELGQAGGIEQATYELVCAISALDRRNSYRVFAPRSACTDWDFPAGFGVQRHYSDPVSRQFEVAHAMTVNQLAQSLGKPAVLTPQMRTLAMMRRLDFDLVHSVAGYTALDWDGCATVLTMNDLQHLHYPGFFTPEDWAHREQVYRKSAENAKHIICISEFTRQDVHKQYGIALEKMSTVWIVPSRNVWWPLSEAARAKLLAGMQLDAGTPFFFFPAHCWPHKNHARLIEAFARVASALPAGTQLVMTGRPLPPEHPAAVLMREHNLARRVVHLGYRSPLEVRALFQGCMALVLPSLFEGFGMPVAEALVAGKPVLCSNVTALPELVGDAALMFDPLDVDAMANSLLTMASDAALRATLSAAAIRRRPLFSAERIARQTMAVYQRVHEAHYGQ